MSDDYLDAAADADADAEAGIDGAAISSLGGGRGGALTQCVVGTAAAAALATAASVADFNDASPPSKSPPTLLSMLVKTDITFPRKSYCPVIVHVTSVALPFGMNLKTR